VAKSPVVAAPVAKTPSVAPTVAKAPVVAAPMVAAPDAKTPTAASLLAKTLPVGAPPAGPVPPLDDRQKAWHWLPLLVVALLVVGLAVTYLTQLGHQSGVPALSTTRNTAAAKPTATSAPATGAPKVSEQPTAAGPTPSSITVAPAPNVDARVGSFLSSYYSNVTKDTSLTWGQLTPTMQQHANGRSGYDGWWKTVASMKVNSAQVNAAGTSAVVSLSFTMNNGVTTTETHRFTFVAHSGGYLIDSDTVIG
jgi:hypothetical protein